MLKKIIAPLCALVTTMFLFAALPAQAVDQGKFYAQVDEQAILAVLADLGFKAQVARASGATAIIATRDKRAPFIVALAPCPTQEAPNCTVVVTTLVAPDTIVPGTSIAQKQVSLGVLNAMSFFGPAKFIIRKGGLVIALDTDYYQNGGIHGNISFSIDLASRLAELGFTVLARSVEGEAAFSSVQALDGQAFEKKGNMQAFAAPAPAPAQVQMQVPGELQVVEPGSIAAQKAVDLITTLIQSKSFRQDVLYSAPSKAAPGLE